MGQEIKIKYPHIDSEKLHAIRDGNLLFSDYQKMLEHVGECELCAEAFSEAVLKSPVSVMPPKYLGDEIKERAAGLDVELSKSLQLFIYSLKVGAAVVTAIIMFFVINFMPAVDLAEKHNDEFAKEQMRIDRQMEIDAKEINRLMDAQDYGKKIIDIQPIDIQPIDIQPIDIQPIDIQPIDVQTIKSGFWKIVGDFEQKIIN